MIDEYWTWAFYGYHSDELKPFSHKPIVARCDDCCQYRVVKPPDYRDLCLSCARIGEGNSMYGIIGEDAPGYGRRGESSPGWRGGKVVVHCTTCGNPIEVVQSKKESQKHFFCCQECHIPFVSSRVSEWFKDQINIETHSQALKDFYSDPINLEKRSAALQGISYDEWEGFAKDNPYCPAFDEICRESNRDKYDRKCFLCGLDESENITSTGKQRKLAVHHVDMNKDQGCNDHIWKLVPLCLHHHRGTHNELVMHRIIYLLENVWNNV